MDSPRLVIFANGVGIQDFVSKDSGLWLVAISRVLAAAVLKCRPVSGGNFCAFGGVLRAVLVLLSWFCATGGAAL